ncbi:MAG TPA: asparagine synthase (glutamine-hydrolyzing) [Pirellulales bacterium]|jgi:asparagine synthase (glutamine-hydrolysing)|nr:asparagine synthase (glutamine-hydrolyzing) [Pirellulales bacterium]
MCGIAAIFRLGHRDVPARALSEMTALVAHRGPNGSGETFFQPAESSQGDKRGDDRAASKGTGYLTGGERAAALACCPPGQASGWTVGLGHRRLSILDLSEAGHQPMSYRERFWITYNGELYNYVELRAELARRGHAFRSQTDTEVLLAAYAEWGVECFTRLRGMWGLVILDLARQQAVFCRDRLGIKPLYLTQSEGLLAAASEIKQFRGLPDFSFQPNAAALWEYILSGYEDSRRTFFAQIKPLAAGTHQTLDLRSGELAPPVDYWFPERVRPSIVRRDEATTVFREQFQETVRIHLRSDVPVGCALSGGLDSSSVAAMISELQPPAAANLQTFSVTFPKFARDERRQMDSVVRALGVRPHFVTPTPEQFAADLDQFVWAHDEPVGSLSQYAAFAVARLTRAAAVPVTLNGQGGDELFAGYWQSYFLYLRNLLRRRKIGSLASHFAGALTPWGNFHLLGQVPVMWQRYRSRQRATQRSDLVAAAHAGQQNLQNRLAGVLDMNDQERRVYEIRELHLPRLLKWDDRNFMAFAVEGRYPFLDHQLIESVLSFEPRVLYARGWTKEPLRRALAHRLPREIIRRRTKFGFEVPQSEWMAGALKPMLQRFAAEDSPLAEYLGPDYLPNLTAAFLADPGHREDASQELFRLFLVDRWLKCFRMESSLMSMNESPVAV